MKGGCAAKLLLLRARAKIAHIDVKVAMLKTETVLTSSLWATSVNSQNDHCVWLHVLHCAVFHNAVTGGVLYADSAAVAVVHKRLVSHLTPSYL